jgi:hypothetical protein
LFFFFPFFPFFSGDSFEENIKRHEAYLALKLGLKSGDKVLVRFEIPISVNFYRNQSLERRTFSTDLPAFFLYISLTQKQDVGCGVGKFLV